MITIKEHIQSEIVEKKSKFTRYFGGILLGTGGLVRAYSDVTQNAIDEAEKSQIILGKEFEVKVDYSNLEKMKYYARTNNINISKIICQGCRQYNKGNVHNNVIFI